MRRIWKWIIFVPALALTIAVYVVAAVFSILYLVNYVAKDMAQELYQLKGPTLKK